MTKDKLITKLKQSSGYKDRQKYMQQLYNKIKKEAGFKESYFRDNLAKKVDGETEVKVVGGIVDVLSDEEIIEVKRIRDWKHAIGQVVVYGSYLSHKKRIHLIDDFSNTNKWTIEDVCNRLDIKVTYENDPMLDLVYQTIGGLKENDISFCK